ncbi:hypothetical protein C8J57DRAFT_1238530 [Mycena rebaudengoi]|nr:hypothetical protein C8J57DRAFT_1238530 [Mycena rebaudengoi]
MSATRWFTLAFSALLYFDLRWRKSTRYPSGTPMGGLSPLGKELNSDIIHLDAAGTSIVVLSSMEAIGDLFEQRSSLYSDRPYGMGFLFSRLRRILFHGAFNHVAAKQYHPQETAAVHEVLRRNIIGTPEILHLALGLHSLSPRMMVMLLLPAPIEINDSDDAPPKPSKKRTVRPSLNKGLTHVKKPTHHRTPRSWFPTTLATLFGGVIENPFTLARRGRVVSEEALLMELFAAEHSDEEPDVGAQEGSGDDYGS